MKNPDLDLMPDWARNPRIERRRQRQHIIAAVERYFDATRPKPERPPLPDPTVRSLLFWKERVVGRKSWVEVGRKFGVSGTRANQLAKLAQWRVKSRKIGWALEEALYPPKVLSPGLEV